VNPIFEKIRKIEALIEGAMSEGERLAGIEARRRLEAKKKKLFREDEPEIEYRISTEDMWHKKLFSALCRKHGLRPYRYFRQKYTTVMVKVRKSFLDDVLWKEYLDYSKQLSALFDDIGSEIISKIHEEEEETVIAGDIGYDGR